jgi:signal transduction histidine kinase
VSLRLRLTLLNTLILLLVGGVLISAVYAVLARNLDQQVDDALRTQIQQLAAAPAFAGPGPRGRFQIPTANRLPSRDTYVQVLDRDGNVLARSESLGEEVIPVPAEAVQAARNGRELFTDVLVDEQPLRQLVTTFPTRPNAQRGGADGLGLLLQVARPVGPQREALASLRTITIAVGGIGVLVSLLAGWFLARAALQPIDLLAKAAAAIGATRDFGRRVPNPRQSRDEVGRLTTEFNSMLDELQASHDQLSGTLAAQRRFVADASHELRTPLATLRGNVDLLQHTLPRGTDAGRDAILADVTAEAERMGRLIAGMLLLAQADAGQHLTLRPVDFGDVAQDAVRAARLLRPAVAVELEPAAQTAWVAGNRERLRQVLMILLDNALKVSPEQGEVRLSVQAKRHGILDGYRVNVTDQGPGVAPADRERIFERFVRGAGSRSGEGTGLGLAIARWIVEEHGGSITVEDAPARGALFSVWLPATTPDLNPDVPSPSVAGGFVVGAQPAL